MAKQPNTPTAEQAEQFDQCIKFWQGILGLTRWRMERGLKPAKAAMASVEFSDDARLVIYRLGDFGATQINYDSLSMTALHEVLHVLLHELLLKAQDRGAESTEVESAEHAVINVLESVLFGALHDGSRKQKKG
jgi:hypothetical protein